MNNDAPKPITLDSASLESIRERGRRPIAELKRQIANNKDDLIKLQAELRKWQELFEPALPEPTAKNALDCMTQTT